MARTADRKERAALALQLVQDEVSYLLAKESRGEPRRLKFAAYYLLANLTYLRVLGADGLAASSAPCATLCIAAATLPIPPVPP